MIDKKLESVAAEIAKIAHKGQVDLMGVDYFSGHLSSVASSLEGDSVLVAIGYLHDIIEDTEFSKYSLEFALMAKSGCPYDVVVSIVDGVVAMTKVSGESYEDYLVRVKANPLARAVKIADIKNNSDESRGVPSDSKYEKRVEKYKKALAFLES